MRTIHRDIVSALIFSKDGKLFQGMKDLHGGGVYADCWHIPGGGVDDGENRVVALIREIREETGIVLSPEQIELVDDVGRGETEKVLKDTGEHVLCAMNFFVYKVILDHDASEVRITLGDDLVAYQWTDINDLNNLKLTPPSIALFTRLGYLNTT